MVNEALIVAIRDGRDTITWHLPENWPWQDAWLNAFDATPRAPTAAAV